MVLPTALPHKLSVDSSDVTRVTIIMSSSALLSKQNTDQDYIPSPFGTLVWCFIHYLFTIIGDFDIKLSSSGTNVNALLCGEYTFLVVMIDTRCVYSYTWHSYLGRLPIYLVSRVVLISGRTKHFKWHLITGVLSLTIYQGELYFKINYVIEGIVLWTNPLDSDPKELLWRDSASTISPFCHDGLWMLCFQVVK